MWGISVCVSLQAACCLNCVATQEPLDLSSNIFIKYSALLVSLQSYKGANSGENVVVMK